MPRPTRILVAVDQSAGARRAVDTATSLCTTLEAELHLVHVKSTHPLLRGRPPTGGGKNDAMRREGEQLLERSRAYAERRVPVAGTHLRFGQRVDRALAHAQQELDADLLVIGASRTGARRGTRDRTVEGTVRRAPGSVLVAREGTPTWADLGPSDGRSTG